LFMKIPKGFIPEQDTDSVFSIIEAAQGTSFQQMKQYQQAVAHVAIEDPNVMEFNSTCGGSFAGLAGPNYGRIFMHLLPRAQRKLDVNGVMNELRPKFAQFPGVRVFMQNPPAIRIGGQLSKSQYQFTLQGPDTEELYRIATVFQRKMAALPGLIDVTSDLLITNPQVNVNVDRDKASALGVTTAQLENALYTAYGEVLEDVQKTAAEPVPLHIRNAVTALMKQVGYGKGYQYAHDLDTKVADMDCLPDNLRGRHYYHPTHEGREKQLAQRLEEIRKLRDQAGKTPPEENK